MRLRPHELESSLARGLRPVYLVSGDEPLQSQECTDQLRAACRNEGFSDRQVFTVDPHFDWSRVLAECNSLSLFSERRLIEIRLPSGKPGAEGSAVLREIAGRGNGENVLLVVAGKLERDAGRAAWVKAIEEAGAWIQVWPLRRRELPAWIRRRLLAAGFRPSEDAVALLAERVEGNLLAAAQEIAKLELLAEPGPLDAQGLASVVADSARFGIFDLADRTLEGDRAAAVRTLLALRGEGVEAALVLWSLSEEIRRLVRLARHRARGLPMDQALRAERLTAKPHFDAAINRIGPSGLHRLLRRCADIDRCIKGLERREPWDELLELVIRGTASASGGRRAAR